MIMKYFTSFLAIAVLMISPAFQKNVRAQNSQINTTLAAEYFEEASVLCKRDKGNLWKVSLCAPMIFVDRETRSVVANQADKEGILNKDGNVFIGHLPAKVNVANTATEWAGVKWTMIIFPLPEDKIRRANLMIHESWHRVQTDIGFLLSDPANSHLDSLAGRIWLQLEWRALTQALTSRGKQRRQAIADALVFRAYRRTLFPNAASEERQLEMNEGLAEYTGVKLSGAPNPNQYVVNVNLKEVSQRQTFVRSFAYASGPAYGVLLDETNADWRKNLKKDDDLGNLLLKRLYVKLPPNLKQAAELRAKNYDSVRLQVFETKRENNRQKILAGYRARLVDDAVLEIPLQKMNMQYNPNNLVPLDPFGTVYPNIRIVDAWGILTVTAGGSLRNPTYTKIYVSAPNDSDGAAHVEGDGWTLELNDGWTIAAGERPGDFIVIKKD